QLAAELDDAIPVRRRRLPPPVTLRTTVVIGLARLTQGIVLGLITERCAGGPPRVDGCQHRVDVDQVPRGHESVDSSMHPASPGSTVPVRAGPWMSSAGGAQLGHPGDGKLGIG